MRNFSPADERQPQGLPTCIRTLTMRACSGTSAKKLAQHGASSGSPAKKLARHGTSSGTSAKKLAQHARKQHFSAILGSQGELFRAPQWERRKQGELFRARSHSRPSRANYFAFRRHVRDAGRRISRTGLDPGRRNMATLKPPTPLHAPNNAPLKPASPLRPKTGPKHPFLTRKGDGGFTSTRIQASKGDRGFRQPAHLADSAWLRPLGRQGQAATLGRRRHHRPQISHAIRLGEVSIMSENVAIPTL